MKANKRTPSLDINRAPNLSGSIAQADIGHPVFSSKTFRHSVTHGQNEMIEQSRQAIHVEKHHGGEKLPRVEERKELDTVYEENTTLLIYKRGVRDLWCTCGKIQVRTLDRSILKAELI